MAPLCTWQPPSSPCPCLPTASPSLCLWVFSSSLLQRHLGWHLGPTQDNPVFSLHLKNLNHICEVPFFPPKKSHSQLPGIWCGYLCGEGGRRHLSAYHGESSLISSPYSPCLEDQRPLSVFLRLCILPVTTVVLLPGNKKRMRKATFTEAISKHPIEQGQCIIFYPMQRRQEQDTKLLV